MSKKNVEAAKSMIVFQVDPTECPFRDFKDNELAAELWGLGPAACRAAVLMIMNKTAPKPPVDFLWVDDQTQPLPRSVRQYLNGWIRAEDLAFDRWEAEVVIFEENDGGKMTVMDMQLSHAQVLMRSSFCRRALSACFILERVEGLVVEHQWENFMFALGPEGWRAKNHIYSPGMKAGGGPQHRPGLSKNGCYLVRLFYLGAWRCVWVNDQVPVDATESPLLPFSPLLGPPVKAVGKQAPAMVTAKFVYLWPLLLCKALLKIAAPDMSDDEEVDSVEDEPLTNFDMFHALTGCMNMTYMCDDFEEQWRLLTSEVPVFSWDDDDDTLASTVKTKGSKKPTTKEMPTTRHSLSTICIDDTRDYPPYSLPGITPGHEMSLLVTMARDLPLKKPLPEPEVALWKYYRWVDWARRHGLYEAYDCPRTRFLKVNGLMKLSYAPHLLDVQSNESITFGFREEQDKTNPPPIKKVPKDANRSQIGGASLNDQLKEELKEWIQFPPLQKLIKEINIIYFPSMFEFTTAASNPPVRVTKAPPNRALDIVAPKTAPLYLQLDGPDENKLRISLTMLNPQVLTNSGVYLMDDIEPSYLLLERFSWFEDCEVPVAKAYVETLGYDSVEVDFQPGRHFFRLWVHSRMNFDVMLLSESSLLLGTRDLIASAAVHECPWAARFLSNLGLSFTNWVRINRSNPSILTVDRDFFRSYLPDLYWDQEAVGYHQALLHWMFRQALQSLLSKRLPVGEFKSVCQVLRHYFCDPDFGLPAKPKPPASLREIVAADPCDCVMPEMEDVEMEEELMEEQQVAVEEKPLVDQMIMSQLLAPIVHPSTSHICDLATEELPCGILREEREKMIAKHEAATVIQAHWRGTWARKCLNRRVTFSPENLKFVMENSFGNLEALSALMNEFFAMYPGAKYAYSVASALSGVYGLAQHQGSSAVTPKCKWVPYFQAVFYCHGNVKVHFDIHGSLPHSTLVVYDNDTGNQKPQTFNAHLTFDFCSNNYGYTVMAHGTLSKQFGYNMDAQWQLIVLSSIDGMFHLCDNELEGCKEIPLQPAYKLHIDEIFLPNRRNILGGILVSVTKHEAICFRAAATSPDLQIVATLREKNIDGGIKEVARCSGKGEIYWPFIYLKPYPPQDLFTIKKKSMSHAQMNVRDSGVVSARALSKSPKDKKPASAGKTRSTTKLNQYKTVPTEPKQYYIDVTAPGGWPLSLAQWKRVDEVRNTIEIPKVDVAAKKSAKDKPSTAKDKSKEVPQIAFEPLPDDAYVELECSLSVVGGIYARRNDERDLEFAAARKAWDVREPGRNARGAQIRKDFRAEFLVALPPPPSDSVISTAMPEETFGEELFEGEAKKEETQAQQGPTPVSESGMIEMSVESEEESKYLLMPEQLRDKFIPLYFLPFCMKDMNEDESVLVSPDMAEAAKQDRHARIEAALERMRELQEYNERHVLGRQKMRCQRLEKLFVDSQWSPELAQVLEERNEAITQETLARQLSATKKKQEQKTTGKK